MDKKRERVDAIFFELTQILGCSWTCEDKCVFDGAGSSCPLNDFQDRIIDALEGSVDNDA